MSRSALRTLGAGDRSALIQSQIEVLNRPIRAVVWFSALLFTAAALVELLVSQGVLGGWRIAYGLVLLAMAGLFARTRSRRGQVAAAVGYLFALSAGIALPVLLDPSRLAHALAAFVLVPVVTGVLWTRTSTLPLAVVAWSLPPLALLAVLGADTQEWLSYLLHLCLAAGVGEVLRRLRLRGAADVYLLRRELQQRAISDPLTGVLNRSGWKRRAGEEMARAARERRPLSLVFFDLDRFKAVNDRHGHGVGDRVLEQAAIIIGAGLREGDPLARFGGEEFVALLPGACAEAAVGIAERIRQQLSAARLQAPVTLSAGVAEALPEETLDGLTARADAALLRAKQAGRNRVVLAGDSDAATRRGTTATARRRGTRSRRPA